MRLPVDKLCIVLAMARPLTVSAFAAIKDLMLVLITLLIAFTPD
jgi:hypothetical protein